MAAPEPKKTEIAAAIDPTDPIWLQLSSVPFDKLLRIAGKVAQKLENQSGASVKEEHKPATERLSIKA